MSAHTCHARGCKLHVRPELLMCYRHWRMVPRRIQAAVYKYYRAGQCEDIRPSAEWHEAASAAIGYVALLEGQGLTFVESNAVDRAGFGKMIKEWRARQDK